MNARISLCANLRTALRHIYETVKLVDVNDNISLFNDNDNKHMPWANLHAYTDTIPIPVSNELSVFL
jgi:hypothetical protein